MSERPMAEKGNLDFFGLVEAWDFPEVCPGCGCTMSDACVMVIGYEGGEFIQGGCRWVETEDGWRCSGCVWPDDRVRGPVHDHRQHEAVQP